MDRRMDRRTDGSILICHPKFLRGHNYQLLLLIWSSGLVLVSLEVNCALSGQKIFHANCAISGVIKFFSQPLVQDKWPVKIHLS